MTSEPLFFRESEVPLFGCYHAPPGLPIRSAAVLLCAPHGHEYTRAHRALRFLADRLAAAGFPTLRFDYRGCGDSALDSSDGTLDHWVEDIAAATETCRERSGLERVCAIGLRLGASLALQAQASRKLFDSLVLWDPIVSGGAHLTELARQHTDMMRSIPGVGSWGDSEADLGELLGFEYSHALIDQLQAMDLSRVRCNGAQNVLVLQTDYEGDSPPDAQLDVQAARLDRDHVRDPRIWMEDADKAMIPQQGMQAVVQWLSEVYP